jgi:alanine-glyoxylate transaminase/serine-glyoxylate transaminase/serine-pyruvate transaminase
MGSVSANDLLAVLGGLERALAELGHSFKIGKSLQTFQMEVLKAN